MSDNSLNDLPENTVPAEDNSLEGADSVIWGIDKETGRSELSLNTPRPKPGPGLGESLLWIFGFCMAQMIVGAIVLNVIVVYQLMDVNQGAMPAVNQLDLQALSKQALNDYGIWFVGTVQLIMFGLVVPAVVLRVGISHTRKRLPLGPIPSGHLVLMFFMFLPAVMFCNHIHMGLQLILKRYILPLFPMFDSLEDLSSMKMLEGMQSAPFLVLLFIIAVCPAVVEELLFRGLIGRGLVARLNLVPGIVITSVLFAVVHMAPTQVIALIPLAVVMHLLHLATRSIWAPMIFHFMNNALACAVLKYSSNELIDQKLKDSEPFSMAMLFGSGSCLLAMCWLLWSIRTKYYSPDGWELPIGYQAAEIPTEPDSIKQVYGQLRVEPLLSSVAGGILFICCWAYAS